MSSDPALTAFIASNPDARELKRALAVHMRQLGFKQRIIQSILGVQSSFLMRRYPKANAQHTVDFTRYLQQRRPGQKLLIFWDGVSYHHQQAMRDFLQAIQADVPPNEWKIDCTRLAPYTPQENPVEDIWLKGKTFVRSHALWHHLF